MANNPLIFWRVKYWKMT